jgi:hypothetical protein
MEAKKVRITKAQIEEKLHRFKEIEAIFKESQKELKELKEFLKENVQPGQYGSMCIIIEYLDVKSYVVNAHVRETLKVMEVK